MGGLVSCELLYPISLHAAKTKVDCDSRGTMGSTYYNLEHVWVVINLSRKSKRRNESIYRQYLLLSLSTLLMGK